MELYPEEILNRDLEKIRSMSIPPEEKKLKSNALVNIYYMQESISVEPFAIRDYRENILGKEFMD